MSRVLETKPYMVTFMPEVDKEITTQGGLTLDEEFETVEEMAKRLQEVGVKVGLHIEPDTEMVKRTSRINVDAIKLHTGMYVNAQTEEDGLAELEKIERSAKSAGKANLMVMAGQGLDYQNLTPLARLGVIDEYVFGQAVIARAVMAGMPQAVRDMLDIVRHETAQSGA